MTRRPQGPDPRTLLSSAELEAANRQAIPKVAMAAPAGGGAALGLALAIGLGLFTFSQMNAARLRADAPQPAAAPAPEPVMAPAPAPAAPIPPRPEPVVLAPASMDDESFVRPERLRAPALVIDIGPSAEERARMAGGAPGAVEGLTASERFALRTAEGERAPATAVAAPDLSTTVLEGGLISGVLETAINSDLPGFVRAIVSENVRSFDGSAVLIPRGSRLVGQYRSGLAIGESRAFVIWTRLILPDGRSIQLASPTTDTLGRAGLGGKVDRHFLQRFGSAILLSIIGAGLDAAVDQGNGQIVISSTTQAFSIAQTALSANMNIPPTIKVPQGAPIRIFVARDLNFPDASAGAGTMR